MLSVTTRKHKLWTIYLANNTPFNCYCSLINIWLCFVKITIAPLKYPKRVFRRNYANKLQLSRHDVGLKIEAILKSIGNKKRKSQKHALDMRSDNKSSSAVCCPLNVWVLVRHTIKVYQRFAILSLRSLIHLFLLRRRSSKAYLTQSAGEWAPKFIRLCWRGDAGAIKVISKQILLHLGMLCCSPKKNNIVLLSWRLRLFFWMRLPTFDISVGDALGWVLSKNLLLMRIGA